MQENLMIVDFEFGLRQLNGNKSLLYRLLRKFAAEYRDVDVRLQDLVGARNISGAEDLVHTLKGVSGNLGCNAVYQDSRLVNEQLKHGEADAAAMQSLFDNLNKTLAVIDDLPDEHTASAPETKPDAHHEAHQAFCQALEHHEYINDEKLANWLAKLSLTPAQQEQLTAAVTSLEYDQALTILATVKN
ncbi:Hpt domain-containing protein [Alteromonas gilva]|uniref:Hpt domain-containing protein n=1 Tax=Alteromonas gilva TaxID=2987522 RepID=A0ABT5L3P3_9ALTE|nr:Hpt domain-containing protein [Alteromonas gilva]MDC8831644.1 Hpt domain-containing protein [Alteromonas gilva]